MQSPTATTTTDHEVIKALTRNTATTTTTTTSTTTHEYTTPIDQLTTTPNTIISKPPTSYYSYNHLKKTTSNFFKRSHHSSTRAPSSSTTTLSQPNTPTTYYYQQLKHHQPFSRLSLCSNKPINLYQEEEEEHTDTHLLRNTPSNRSSSKPNQLLNRLRKKRSLLSSNRLADEPSKELPSLGPKLQEHTTIKPIQHRLIAPANRLAHPASKSLSNINLSWLDSKPHSSSSPSALGSSSASAHQTPTDHPNNTTLTRSSTISSTRTSTTTTTLLPTPTDGNRPSSRTELDHHPPLQRPSFLLNRARQTIYHIHPLLSTSSSTSTTTTTTALTAPINTIPNGAPDPAPPAPSNTRSHSPTEIALNHLDQILRGGPPTSSNTTNHLCPPPRPSLHHHHHHHLTQRCPTPVYPLSPPTRPSRKPTLHQRTLSSELNGLLKPSSSSSSSSPPAPTSSSSSSGLLHLPDELGSSRLHHPRKVLIQPHTWNQISISAATQFPRHRLDDQVHVKEEEEDRVTSTVDARRVSDPHSLALSDRPDHHHHVLVADGQMDPTIRMFPLPPPPPTTTTTSRSTLSLGPASSRHPSRSDHLSSAHASGSADHGDDPVANHEDFCVEDQDDVDSLASLDHLTVVSLSDSESGSGSLSA